MVVGAVCESSDGVLVAEVVSHYFPKLVELHNYIASNSVAKKRETYASWSRTSSESWTMSAVTGRPTSHAALRLKVCSTPPLQYTTSSAPPDPG